MRTEEEKPSKPTVSEPKKGQSKTSSPISWSSVGLLLVAGSGLVAYYQYCLEQEQSRPKKPAIAGKAMLGGPYNLIDENGKHVSSEDFKGYYPLIYFGFTMCPDICPAELIKMQKALDLFDNVVNRSPIKPIFISIDPERDTPEQLKRYKKDYDPRITWLTGSMEEVTKVAKSFRVYFSIPELEKPGDEYLVDHSIFFYLMDRQGNLLEYMGKNLTAEECCLKMTNAIREDQKDN